MTVWFDWGGKSRQGALRSLHSITIANLLENKKTKKEFSPSKSTSKPRLLGLGLKRNIDIRRRLFMKKILILGSGAGGRWSPQNCTGCLAIPNGNLRSSRRMTCTITNLAGYLSDWHLYRPGLNEAQSWSFIPKGVNYVLDEVVGVDPDKRRV